MRLKSLLLAPAAALLLAAAPATAPLYQAPPAQAERVRATVEFLADDLLEGRSAGKRGHEVAAVYVASRYRALGLEPAGDNGTWYQRVPFRRAVNKSDPVVVLKGRGADQPLTIGKDIGIRPSVLEQNRSVEAGLVFVGYGINDPKLKQNDFAGIDLRGKIAIALSGVPKGTASDVAAHLGSQKDEMAAAAGAIGIIEISSGNTPSSAPVTDWVDAKGRAGRVAPGMRLSGTIGRDFAAQLFQGSRQPLSGILAQQAAGQRVRAFPLNATLSVKSESTWTDFTSPAVIGRMPGGDPRLADETVILMGHLDHLGMKADAKPGEDAIYNGAIDNAAGIATMLEAAERFVASGEKPKRSLLFIAQTGEELGLLGSFYWAAHPTVPLDKVSAAIDLDMPLPLYDFNDVTAFGAEHSTVADAVAEAGRGMGISVGPDPMPQEGIFVRSDHYPLVLRGVPAILMFTGHGNGGKAFWDQFLPGNYHSVKDDLSQPINWGALARYGELNYRIARTLADAPQPAAWRAGSYFAPAPGARRQP